MSQSSDYHNADKKLYDETSVSINDNLECYITLFSLWEQDKKRVKLSLPFECTDVELDKEETMKLIETLQKLVTQI